MPDKNLQFTNKILPLMPLAKPLPDLRRELEQQLAEGNEYLPAILKRLQELLPEGSEKRNTVIALMGRLNDANKKALRQTISDDDLQVEYNALRADLLDFISGLTEADFDATTANKIGPDGEPAPKQGSVLYRIPRKMPMQKETECVVRIAISEDAIVENITLDKSVALKELNRVSDVMQVELSDPDKDPVFKVRTTSEPQQLITPEGYTEWFFYVEPARSGVFPIEVKVAVLEMALNNIYRKEIVFRETVEIVTEGAPPPEAGKDEFKAAGAVLNFQSQSLPGNQSGAPLDSTPAAPKTERSVLSKAGAFVAAAAIAAVGYVAAFKPEIPDWYWTKYAEGTPEAYAEHIDRFPNSPYRQEAFCHRAMLTGTLEVFREYQKIYPEGACIVEVEQALKALENKRLEDIRRGATAEKIIGFINDFPDSRHLDDLMQIAQSRPELKTTVWDKFENIYWEALQKSPTVPTLRTFLKTFPDTKRLPDLKRITEPDSTLKKEVGRDIESAWLETLRKNLTVPTFRAFATEFPDSEWFPEIKQLADSSAQLAPADQMTILSEIETAILQSIQRRPAAPEILDFLTLFPQSARLLELKRLVDTIPQVKSEVSPALENAFWQKLEKAPAADNISELLREFPQLSSVRLLELKKIAEKNRQFKKTFLPEIKTRIAVLQPKRAPVTTSTPSSTSTAPNQPEPQKPTDTPAPPLPPANALPKPVKPSMVWVQGGTFDMGCTEEQGGNCSSKEEEKPVFDIKVGSYSLGKCEVTFDEYDLFCEHTRREKPDDNGWGRGKRPVVNVSWFEAVDYCNWLSQQHGFAPAYINHILQPRADGYRLPTEAEWEYAARGGSKSQGYQFAGSNNLDEIAWHKANSGNRTHPVGAKKGNELRLEDMSGNVLEWCNDWFSSYTGNGQANPHGPSNGEERVLRSSSWTSYNTQQYVAARRHDVPGNKNDYIGFRLARD